MLFLDGLRRGRRASDAERLAQIERPAREPVLDPHRDRIVPGRSSPEREPDHGRHRSVGGRLDGARTLASVEHAVAPAHLVVQGHPGPAGAFDPGRPEDFEMAEQCRLRRELAPSHERQALAGLTGLRRGPSVAEHRRRDAETDYYWNGGKGEVRTLKDRAFRYVE